MAIKLEQLGQYFNQAQTSDAPEPQEIQNNYPNSTYLVVSKIGYLLGVSKDIFTRGQLSMEHYDVCCKI